MCNGSKTSNAWIFIERGRGLYSWKNLSKKAREDVLEVDVEYPKELHKNHNELQFLAIFSEN